jgi:2,4-dienoyl-CoA reductase-like NADH-dependent reductase (Old Yellow Enzyme family)
MYTNKYPHLFSSVKLGSTFFKSRLFAAPLGLGYYSEKNSPNDEIQAMFERRAMGGAAAVSLACAVVNSKTGSDHNLMELWVDNPEELPSYFRMAQLISRYGAVPVIELEHNGGDSGYSASQGNQLHDVIERVNMAGQLVPEMTEEVIEEVIEAFANSAAFVKYCGFGMVTIHAAHGWFLTKFLDPEFNTRKDRWGGKSVENRCRILVAIIDRIKRKCGQGFPVDVRMSGALLVQNGYGIDEGVAIAKQLDGKADLIDVSAGSSAEMEIFFARTHPSMFHPDGVNLPFASEIKKNLTTTKVAALGSISDPEMMEEILAAGKVDIIYTNRSLIADFDMPKKAQAGKSDEIRPCLRCLECFTGIVKKRNLVCAVNPEAGFEDEAWHVQPPAAKKNILVIGGGIAGMQAALSASERGHKVTLCEKGSRLGGVLRCEEKVPFKKHLTEYIEYQARMLTRSPADIRLGVQVTPEYAAMIGPDVIIAALGARPIIPKIPGIDGKNVFGAEEIYYHPEKAEGNVVIIGGGLVGIELAIFLGSLGRNVTILEMTGNLSDGGNPIHGYALNTEIKRYGIQAATSTKALEIDEKGVVAEFIGGLYTLQPSSLTAAASMQLNSFYDLKKPEAEIGSKKLFEADTVVYALGLNPLTEEADAFHLLAPEFYQLGDCLVPKNILNATSTAYYTVRNIS